MEFNEWREGWMILYGVLLVVVHYWIIFLTEEWVKSFWWDLDPEDKFLEWRDMGYVERLVLLLATVQNYILFFIAMAVIIMVYSFVAGVVFVAISQFILRFLNRDRTG